MSDRKDSVAAGGNVFVGLAASMISAVLFGFGLVAPLTPSQGCPSTFALLACAVLPVALAGGGALASSGLLRVALVAQALVIAGAAIYLLERIGCWG